MKFRYQLSAYSPIRPTAVADAMMAAAGLHRHAPTALRHRLQSRYSAHASILYGSGTQALQQAIAMATRGSHRDGFVALPAYTCYDMASAAVGAGVAVSLYDVVPTTLAPDLASFERVLSAGASAAVVGYLYGVPFDWSPFATIAERYGVPLIEDAAQGHGASWRGIPLGALGQTSIISFGRGKGWTGGGGGAVLLRDPTAQRDGDLRETPPNARIALGLAAQWLLGRPALYGVPRSIPFLALGETVYHLPARVHSMTEASASAAVRNEAASTDEAERRATNARRFIGALHDTRAGLIAVPADAQAGYIRFPVLLPGGMSSIPPRAAELGVSPTYPTTLADLPALSERLVAIETNFPGANCLVRDLVTLPSHSLLGEAERTEIIDMISAV